MKTSQKVTRLSFLCLSLALMIFLVIASGGCGGSSGGPVSYVGDNNNNNNNKSTEVTVLDENYDLDGNGIPDILDFDDVEEVSYAKDEVIVNEKISVPSRHYLQRLRPFSSADTFVMNLTAGTEYTVEISRGKAYNAPIGDDVPDVEILNPQGNELAFLDTETSSSLSTDVIELSVYPPDEPYVICGTFTPSVSGSYTIKLSNTSGDADIDCDATLFVYKELRNDDTGEAGYYERYKFVDASGDFSATISIADIMALRKAWNDAGDVISETWETDENGNETVLEHLTSASAYFDVLDILKQHYGIVDDEKDTYGNTTEKVTGIVNESDDDEGEQDETVSSSAFSAAAASGTKIKQELYGIPYTDDFQPGTGYFAVTGVQANTNAIKKFELGVPAKKKIVSNYTASFVSSQEDREKISTTTTGASLAIGGFGLGVGYTSKSKFKFGLTSTTFVIHYEEAESSYRVLDEESYKLKTRAKKLAGENLAGFREKYGDYFVAGYKYGGTYDAFITITTTTMEELQAVKTQFTASFETSKGSFDAKVGNETQETLKKNNATVSIRINTAGIDTSQIPEIPKGETQDMNDVVKSLNAFREALKKTSAEYYNPVYVMLKRYIALDEVEEAMDKQKYNGLIPMTPKHSTKIMAFNREKMIMDSYYNVISDLKDNQIDASVRNSYKREYEEIDNEISNGGNEFYAESNSARMDTLKTQMEKLGGRLKDVGDRYVFYQVLMSEQKKEEACSSNGVTSKPFGYNGGSIGKVSFAVSTAVTSDIAAGRKDFGDKKNEAPTFIGTHVEWRPGFTAYTKDGSSDAVFYYINVAANNTNDLNRDVTNSPCIGKSQANFYFQSGGTRWGQWEINLWSMRFSKELYPFNGLK